MCVCECACMRTYTFVYAADNGYIFIVPHAHISFSAYSLIAIVAFKMLATILISFSINMQHCPLEPDSHTHIHTYTMHNHLRSKAHKNKCTTTKTEQHKPYSNFSLLISYSCRLHFCRSRAAIFIVFAFYRILTQRQQRLQRCHRLCWLLLF